MPYSVRLTHAESDLEALEGEWDALLARSQSANVFLSHEWMKLCWRSFGDSDALWLVTVREPGGALVGIAPLMLGWRSPMPVKALRWIRWRQVEFIGQGLAADHLDFITAPGQEVAVTQAILGELWAHRFQWDALHFGGIPANSPSLSVLQGRGVPWQTVEIRVCPQVALPDDWDTFFMGLSHRKRKEQRRFLRQLDAAYPEEWTWRIVESPEEVRQTLDALMVFHQTKWEALDYPGAFASPEVMTFHHDLAQCFLTHGMLRLLRLDIQGELVAALYTLRFGDTVYDFSSGFNYDFADYSPGQVLTHKSLEHAIGSGVKVYDFLRGDEEYKGRWGAEESRDVVMRWIASPQARLAHWSHGALRQLWQLVKRVMPGSVRARARAMIRRARS